MYDYNLYLEMNQRLLTSQIADLYSTFLKEILQFNELFLKRAFPA